MDNTMIYPPIKDVVKKLGEDCSRYDLVIAAAKRARSIAQAEMKKEEEKGAVKPITKAVSELMDDDFYIVHTDPKNAPEEEICETQTKVIDLNDDEEIFFDEEDDEEDDEDEELV